MFDPSDFPCPDCGSFNYYEDSSKSGSFLDAWRELCLQRRIEKSCPSKIPDENFDLRNVSSILNKTLICQNFVL